MLKGNKGDWSEVYSFLLLLTEGVLKRADANLSPSTEDPYIVLEINRDGLTFVRNADFVDILKDGASIGSCSYEKLKCLLSDFWLELSASSGNAFSCPSGERALKELHQSTLKAANDSKVDLVVKLVDQKSLAIQTLGFSIKSNIGNASTLFNGSHATKFVFQIDGANQHDRAALLSIKDDPEAIKAFLREKETSIDISLYDMMDDTCRKNFCLIDSFFPLIFSEAIKLHYFGKAIRYDELSSIITSKDPLHMESSTFYEKKFKDFLVAVALGMEPKKEWSGEEQANGGYIVVKKDGTIVCYHIYERAAFRDYLFTHCKMDTPSGTKFLNQGETSSDGSIYEKDGRLLMNLNRQIRFC